MLTPVQYRVLSFKCAVLLLLFSRVAAAQDFVGSEVCAGCHQAEWDNWQHSHHAQAMAEVSVESVLADFDEVVFDSADGPSRFFMEDEAYFVELANEAGQQTRFRITHTVGFEPLQQYLVAREDGRLQALSIAWDSRPEADGGQRWFQLYPDEVTSPEDSLHWTGSFQNANSRCIACHTTGFEKGYDPQSDTYESRWQAVNVGCEACHGPGSDHLAWTEAVTETAEGPRGLENAGFPHSLENTWEPAGSERPIPAEPAVTMNHQIQSCAGCHSRRSELQAHDPAADYHDNYRLSPLREGLYHADGQIQDEVYVTGSFLQSRMFREHVSCGNCHEPHSNNLHVEGNGLCLQCHNAGMFQTEDHLLHDADSAGGQCVSCHMPETTYMQVDPRRDHSLRIPDPFASLQVGTPNACTGCHADRDDSWAAYILIERTGRETPYYAHTIPIASARAGDSSVAPDLRALAMDGSQPAMIRAIALIESARFPSQQHMRTVLQALSSENPVLRASAAMALDFLDVTSRFEYLSSVLDDPAKVVRMTVARQLNSLPESQLSEEDHEQFRALMAEYEQSLLLSADLPEPMTDLGVHYVARGDLEAAEAALRKARLLSPDYLPAMLNLADVQRARGRDEDAEPLLAEAIRLYPESGEAHHALGLLYVRTGRTAQSLDLFRAAVRLSPDNPRYALVHGLALSETGHPEDAIRTLERARERFPEHSGIYQVLQSLRSP